MIFSQIFLVTKKYILWFNVIFLFFVIYYDYVGCFGKIAQKNITK